MTLVRGTAVREVVGGKGNNVARASSCSGVNHARSRSWAGAWGLSASTAARSGWSRPDCRATVSPTRVILTVHTGATAEQSAFFDPDPAIAPQEADELAARVEAELAAAGVEALCLSGSSPSAATHGLYSDLIALAGTRRSGVP